MPVEQPHHVTAQQVAYWSAKDRRVNKVKKNNNNKERQESKFKICLVLPSSMLLPEHMGWTFHRVCIKEASTWMLPLEIDKCCRGDGTNTGSIYFTAVTVQVELRDYQDRVMETATHFDTL